jgi:hypothetical protein
MTTEQSKLADLRLANVIEQADMERLAELVWSDKDRIVAALRAHPQTGAVEPDATQQQRSAMMFARSAASAPKSPALDPATVEAASELDRTPELIDWLRHAPSNEWCSTMLIKAAETIERLQAGKDGA